MKKKRVVLAPAGIDSLVRAVHTVYVESGAGEQSHFKDEEYGSIGAQIVYSAEEAFKRSELIAKVASLSDEEAVMLQEDQILFSFLHLAVGKKNVIENLS